MLKIKSYCPNRSTIDKHTECTYTAQHSSYIYCSRWCFVAVIGVILRFSFDVVRCRSVAPIACIFWVVCKLLAKTAES